MFAAKPSMMGSLGPSINAEREAIVRLLVERLIVVFKLH